MNIIADGESIDQIYQEMISSIQQSFSCLYSALKARELRTLRQLQAVRKLCESSHTHFPVCLNSVHISYVAQKSILKDIALYGDVKLDSVDLNGDTFVMEDYINPEDDHMYSYKEIDKIVEDKEHLKIIEEAALREVTKSNCVCDVHITDVDIQNCFKKDVPKQQTRSETSEHVEEKIDTEQEKIKSESEDERNEIQNNCTSEKSKIDPMEQWLNVIKNEIEIEPMQVTEVMEHRKIDFK